MRAGSISRLSLVVVVVAAAIIGAFIAAMRWQYEDLRQRRFDVANQDAQRVLVAFDDHAARLFTYADSYLRTVRAFYQERGGEAFVAQDGGDRLRELIEAIRPDLGEIFIGGTGIVNADGYLAFSVRKGLPRDVSIANLEYFKALRGAEADIMVIDPTRKAKMSGQMAFRIARAIRIDGRFVGVIVVTLLPEAINDFYSKFNLGANSVLTMAHAPERKLIARHPPAPPESYDRPLGAMMSWDKLRPDVINTGVAASPLDGITRTFHNKVLADYPIAIAVGVAHHDIDATLEDTRRNLTWLAASFSGGVLVVTGLLLALLSNNQRLQIARALAEAAGRRSDAILSSAGEGVCGVDAAGRVSFINPAGRRMLGWDDEGAGEALSPIRLDEIGSGGVTRIQRSDGRSFDAECSVSAVAKAEDVGAVQVVVFRDVSERKALEETLKRTMADLEQFAYVASHDLRQPLRAVTQYLTLLKRDLEGKLDADQLEYLGFAMDGSARMNRLILDLLEYSRTGRGAELKPTPLRAPVDDALENLTVAIDDAQADVVVAESLPMVLGDANELTRLMQNLIGNAVKYRAPGRAPRVAVSCAAGEAGWRVVAVSDNGMGIRAADYDRAFGIFQRLVPSGAFEGSGIGLAICKKIVERHGGRIWIESVVGQGTTFFFTLQAAEADAASP